MQWNLNGVNEISKFQRGNYTLSGSSVVGTVFYKTILTIIHSADLTSENLSLPWKFPLFWFENCSYLRVYKQYHIFHSFVWELKCPTHHGPLSPCLIAQRDGRPCFSRCSPPCRPLALSLLLLLFQARTPELPFLSFLVLNGVSCLWSLINTDIRWC